jgi:hypothetical protein
MGWTKRGVERIGKLTASQEAKLPSFQDKWNRIAVSTEPFDIDSAIEGIERFATAWEVKPFGDEFYETPSPARGWKKSGFDYPTDFLNAAHYENFYAMWHSRWGTRCRLTRAFLPSVVRTVEEILERNIVRPLRLVNLAPSQQTGHFRRYIHYGQSDAPWLAVADFFATVLENEHCKKLSGLMQAVSSSGFIWIRPNKVIFCDRPEIAKYDARGRPHCEDGPALKYRDGYTYYAIHGVPVPEKYILTPADRINFADVIKEENAAVRMAVIEKFGFRHLMDIMKYRRISEANGNALLEFALPAHGNSESMRFRVLYVKWRDKTGERETMLPVPRLARQFGEDCPENVNDCEQVRRWTLGWPKEAMAVAET